MAGGFLEEGTFGCDMEEVFESGAPCELLTEQVARPVAHIPTAWHAVGA